MSKLINVDKRKGVKLGINYLIFKKTKETNKQER